MAPTSRSNLVIDSSGSIVSDGDGDKNRSGGSSRGFSQHIPREIDVFGFTLEPKQFLIVILLAALMLGSGGTLVFLAVLGLYTAFQRMTESSSGGYRGTGKRSGVRFGSNIKGVSDLPKPPQGG